MKFLLAILLILNAQGALAIRQGNYGEVGPGISTSISVTFTNATAAGSLILAGTRPSDGSMNVTMAAGGNSFFLAATPPRPSAYSYHIFALSNAPAGLTTVTMSGGDSTGQQRMWILEVTGIATNGTVLEDVATDEGTSGTAWSAGSVTTLTDGAFLILCLASDGDQMHSDPAVPTGWNAIDLQTCCDDDKTGVMWDEAGAAGSHGGTANDDQSAIWSAALLAFKAVSESGGESAASSVQISGSLSVAGSLTISQQ